MTDNETPNHPEPQIPPLPQQEDRFNLQPIEGSLSFIRVIESMLKKPGRLLYECGGERYGHLLILLLILSGISLAAYGLTLGSFTWSQQLWIAPLKLSGGLFFSAMICIPSLVIFSFLSGSDASIRETIGLLAGMLGLLSLLLLGFAPVVWVFSQSTTSIAFMGFLHLSFYLISLILALRFLNQALRRRKARSSGFIAIWSIIFMLVSLQMSTTLRPLLADEEYFFTSDKKFFLTHWLDNMADDLDPEYTRK